MEQEEIEKNCNKTPSDQEDKYYSLGRLFKTFEELMEFSEKFPDMPCDIRYFKSFFEKRLKEMEINLSINPNFSNRTAMKLVHNYTSDFLKKNNDQ